LDIYLVGATDSSDFPLKKALQGSLGGGYDAFVAKFSDFGEKLAFSTFLGGVLLDSATGSALYKNSHLYLAGYTGSHDFPVKKPIQGVKASSQDAFVTKISSSGDKMVFSTFLGGNGIDRGQGIAVDKKGAAYVTGWTEAWDFPTKKQVFNNRPSTDAFVTKIDKGGNQIVYSTYIGGSYADWGYAIAVDKRKAAVIVGITKSSLFPLKNALQTSLLGDADVFITKIHPKGARMQFSTYLGGSGFDQARTVAVDAKKAIYIAGETYASDFPLKKALRSIFKGVDEGFVLKIK
jgi:hypothetical protein